MKGRPTAPNSHVSDKTYRTILSPTKHLFANGTTRCDPCLRTLHDLKRQAITLILPSPRNKDFLLTDRKGSNLGILENLHLMPPLNRFSSGRCDFCDAAPEELKHDALQQIRNVDFARGDSHPCPYPPLHSKQGPGSKSSSTHGSPILRASSSSPRDGQGAAWRAPRTSPHHHRLLKHPLAAKGTYVNGFFHPLASSSSSVEPGPAGMYSPKTQSAASSSASSAHTSPQHSSSAAYHPPPIAQAASIAAQQHTISAAASFFTRAGQKMHGSTSGGTGKKKRKHYYAAELGSLQVNTSFCDLIRLTPPPAPPQLLKTNPAGRNAAAAVAKVKVIVRVCHPETGKGSDATPCISVDQRKKQVTLYDPGSTLGGFTTPSQRRAVSNAPKMFAFDAVYAAEDATSELCACALSDIIQAVVGGTDGCLFSFGHAKLGKTYTMLGSDTAPSCLGAIPCAIAWLFRLIEEHKDRTGARFSVRVSAVEVFGKDELLKDLLAEVAKGSDAATAPGVYLREDPISGTQLENQSELRAPTADKAAFYLDAALASRTSPESEEDGRLSHLLFTLHVYQYRVEKSGAGTGVAGGRSRLHLIDLGSGRSSKDHDSSSSSQSVSPATSSLGSLTFSALANVLLALANGQRHIPNRASKLSQLLREAMGSLGVRICMIAQASSNVQHYNESLQMMQLASKMQRLRRRKARLGGAGSNGASSDDSSSCDSFGMRRAGRLRAGHSLVRTSALTSSEPDYTSSSEQSCDTVIYLGDDMTDGEGPPADPENIFRRQPAPERHQAASQASAQPSTQPSTQAVVRSPRSARTTNTHAWPRAAVKNAIETLSTQKEQWVDGPRAARLASRETWIDGPDGEPERPVMVDKETQSEEPFTESGSSTTTSSQHSTLDRGSSSGPGLSDITERTEESGEKIVSEEQLATAALDSIEPPPLTSAQPTSVTADAALSQPGASASTYVKFTSVAGGKVPNLSQSTTDPLVARVKPFVRDWVAKHSLVASVGSSTGQEPSEVSEAARRALVDSVQSSPAHSLGRTIGDDSQSLDTSAHFSIQSAPHRNPLRSSGRHEKKSGHKTKKSSAPATGTNFARVAEWVKSLSVENPRAQSLSPPPGQAEPETNIYSSLERPFEPGHKRSGSVPPPCPGVGEENERVPPLHPDSASESDKKTSRPTCLRQPDGASNPHLNREGSKGREMPPAQRFHESYVSRHTSSRLPPGVPPPLAVTGLIKTVSGPGPKPNTPTRSSSLLKSSFFGRSSSSASSKPSDPRDSPRKASISSTASSSLRRSSAACQTSEKGSGPCSDATETGGKSAEGTSGSTNANNGTPTKSSSGRDKSGRHKEGRSRLSFLTSPLFGKKKEKEGKRHHGTGGGGSHHKQQSSPHHGSHQKNHHHKSSKKSHTVNNNGDGAATGGTNLQVDSNQPVHLAISSPYSTVTQPRQSMHSSSGHGSDCSSLYGPKARDGGVRCGGGHGGTSSGYESMLRDSEASSSHADSTSESSAAGVASGSATTATSTTQQQSRKSRSSSSSSRRSRSVPPMSGETSEGTQSPASVRRVSPKELELASDEESRRRMQEEAEEICRQIRYEKIRELLAQQEALKEELMEAKRRLMVDHSSWTFDLHVAEQMDPDDSSFIEALQKETAILQKRVDACKSHILLMTCFDLNPHPVRTTDV